MLSAYVGSGGYEPEALDLFTRMQSAHETIGYAQNGYMEKSLTVFVEMIENGIGFNEHTLASVLSACSALKCLKLGKSVLAWVLKKGYSSNQFISSSNVALLTSTLTYSSQGNMTEAQRLFDSLLERNSVVWTALCSGYVKSQQCEAVFKLFRECRTKEALVPDAMIIISVLGACAMQADLSLGKQIRAYILRMRFKVDKKLLSALANQLEKAVEFMRKIPLQIDATIWGAFLNACQMSSDAALVKQADEELLKVEADNGSRYVQLANVYAAKGKWDEMGRIRKKMRGYEAKKLAGCSWSLKPETDTKDIVGHARMGAQMLFGAQRKARESVEAPMRMPSPPSCKSMGGDAGIGITRRKGRQTAVDAENAPEKEKNRRKEGQRA
ncbi:Putative pentatricopeptide repeat-containing protein [Glycine soja]|nr:Putative pentatricopeptide repeat-containing protein [Glycine soja]